ncbi:MAG: carboxymuconolactone decarboxylase family protein [Gammaproteobacteria bacterium]|nr:carboxymuconolactone decarboxylase family protein [Gammaproteobacteria bacterium]
MSWITSAEGTAGATPLEQVLGQCPELLTRYRAFYKAIWEEGLVSRRVLELCRLRIAAIHGCDQEWSVRDACVELNDAELQALETGDRSAFGVEEQAALILAEQIPYQHHQVTDQQTTEAGHQLSTPGAVALLTALAFFDVTCRLKLTLDVAALPAQLAEPPLNRGALA